MSLNVKKLRPVIFQQFMTFDFRQLDSLYKWETYKNIYKHIHNNKIINNVCEQ